MLSMSESTVEEVLWILTKPLITHTKSLLRALTQLKQALFSRLIVLTEGLSLPPIEQFWQLNGHTQPGFELALRRLRQVSAHAPCLKTLYFRG